MKKASIFTLAAIALTALAVPTAQAGAVPKLRLVTVEPLVVRGESFRPGERVVVTALTAVGPKRVVVRTTSGGRFGASFRLPNQPCGKAFAVRAVGTASRPATIAVPGPPCVPPPID
ncbi:MAG TPA: hypothetical protein VHR46_05460 [Gaiella sp.]|jgi:hypothetical protein|nr:hypothetical protein [Gaiella sp.]